MGRSFGNLADEMERQFDNVRKRGGNRNIRHSDGGIYDRAARNTGVDTRSENYGRSNSSQNGEKREYKSLELFSEDISARYMQLPKNWQALHITSEHPRSNPVDVYHLVCGPRTYAFKEKDEFKDAIHWLETHDNLNGFQRA